MAKCNMPAGIAAAMAVLEYHSRNMRSMKFITVQDIVATTSGTAIRGLLSPQGLPTMKGEVRRIGGLQYSWRNQAFDACIRRELRWVG